MAYVVAEPCVNCKYTDCVTVCPVECFYEGENILYLHPDECIDCGACVPECPVQAIFPAEEVPSEWQHWTGINKQETVDSPGKWPKITEKKAPMGPPK